MKNLTILSKNNFFIENLDFSRKINLYHKNETFSKKIKRKKIPSSESNSITMAAASCGKSSEIVVWWRRGLIREIVGSFGEGEIANRREHRANQMKQLRSLKTIDWTVIEERERSLQKSYKPSSSWEWAGESRGNDPYYGLTESRGGRKSCDED